MDITVKVNGVIQRGIKAMEVDENGDLWATLTDDTKLNLGSVKGPKGDTGPRGDVGPQGVRGPEGPRGPIGVGIDHISKESGDGSPGTVDTYKIYLSDGQTTSFQVYNGADGEVLVDDTLTGSGVAAEAKAVGDALNAKLNCSGGTMTGDLSIKNAQLCLVGANGEGFSLQGTDQNADGHPICDLCGTHGDEFVVLRGVADPKLGGDAANKDYVDRKVQGGSGGEAGGYYTPSVDSSGNLNWTPSAAGMPQVPGANIMGPRGEQGPQGATGDPGPQGPAGDPGLQGATGATPNLQIGTVETLAAGSNATATITGTTENPKLNLGIPKGADGAGGSGASGGVAYGTCDSGTSVKAKTTEIPGFALATGAVVMVKFTSTNSASAPTLNVSSTGAFPIKKYGSTAADTYQWAAGAVVEFLYDGTNWVMVHGSTATTTNWGVTKLSSSTSTNSATMAATSSAVKTAYDKASDAYGLANSAAIISAGTCDTDASTQTKIVSVPFISSTLPIKIGTMLFVRLVNGNTAPSPILSVNGHEDRIVLFNGTPPVPGCIDSSWLHQFVFMNNFWFLMNPATTDMPTAT